MSVDKQGKTLDMASVDDEEVSRSFTFRFRVVGPTNVRQSSLQPNLLILSVVVSFQLCRDWGLQAIEHSPMDPPNQLPKFTAKRATWTWFRLDLRKPHNLQIKFGGDLGKKLNPSKVAAYATLPKAKPFHAILYSGRLGFQLYIRHQVR